MVSDTRCFALRSDLLLSTVTKVGKSTGRNQRFLHFLTRYELRKLDSAFRTFTQIFLCRSVKGLSQQQRRCRWLVLRTAIQLLPSQRMSGSGARGKSVRHTARHGICSVNAWYRVSKSERYSALRKCKNVVFAGVLSPLSFAIERKGAVGDKTSTSRPETRNTPAAGDKKEKTRQPLTSDAKRAILFPLQAMMGVAARSRGRKCPPDAPLPA